MWLWYWCKGPTLCTTSTVPTFKTTKYTLKNFFRIGVFVYSVVMLCTEGNWTGGRDKSRQTTLKFNSSTNSIKRGKSTDTFGSNRTPRYTANRLILTYFPFYPPRNKTPLLLLNPLLMLVSSALHMHAVIGIEQEELLQLTLPLLGMGM